MAGNVNEINLLKRLEFCLEGVGFEEGGEDEDDGEDLGRIFDGVCGFVG